MKKLLFVFSVMLFSASVFALNTEVAAGEDCPEKAEFERIAAQPNNYFIAQHILINLADPMEKQSDVQAIPAAVCYATYRVKGKDLVSFVRASKKQFLPAEAGQLAVFADRVERLSVQNQLDRLSHNQSHVIQWVLSNLALPLADKQDSEAKDSARIYKQCRVNGVPLMDYVRVHASEYDEGDVAPVLDAFVERVNQLVP